MPKRRSWTVETGPRPKRTAWLKARQRPRRKNALVRVPRNKLAFPQRLSTTLRYVDRQGFDLSAGTAVAPIGWKANGMFDPYINVGGHQPRGFDQFMEQYKMFTVIGSKIAVQWVYLGYDGPSLDATSTGYLLKTMGASSSDSDHAAQAAVVCGIHKGTEALNPGTAEAQMEKDKQTWTIITPQTGQAITSTSLKVSDFFGKFPVGAADYSGDDSNDPTNEVRYSVWCGKTHRNNTDCVTRVVAYVTIEYDVVFTEPKQLVAS